MSMPHRNQFETEDEFTRALRDYFAIHCDQPGEAEIVTAAGLTFSNGEVWADERTSLGSFAKWYRDAPQDERFRLYAEVRYALADAMLKARES
jgi:hypothetical protein